MFGWDRALTMQAGMVFSDEPRIYIKGEFGVRLEDDMRHRERRGTLHAAKPVDRRAFRRSSFGVRGSSFGVRRSGFVVLERAG
jgi:Xaa-Pro aminopeptidase